MSRGTKLNKIFKVFRFQISMQWTFLSLLQQIFSGLTQSTKGFMKDQFAIVFKCATILVMLCLASALSYLPWVGAKSLKDSQVDSSDTIVWASWLLNCLRFAPTRRFPYSSQVSTGTFSVLVLVQYVAQTMCLSWWALHSDNVAFFHSVPLFRW